jgi:hypothetical protein
VFRKRFSKKKKTKENQNVRSKDQGKKAQPNQEANVSSGMKELSSLKQGHQHISLNRYPDAFFFFLLSFCLSTFSLFAGRPGAFLSAWIALSFRLQHAKRSMRSPCSG